MFCTYLALISKGDSVMLLNLSFRSVYVTLQLNSISSLCSLGPYDFGGVLTNSNRDIINGDAIHKRNQSHKEMHWYVF